MSLRTASGVLAGPSPWPLLAAAVTALGTLVPALPQ